MHWILQNNIFDEQGYAQLVANLVRLSIPYTEHKVIPFIGGIEPDIHPEGNVICMGSYSLRHLAKARNWYPGVFDLEPFNFQIQLEKWGDRMLNHDSIVVPFKDAVIDGCAFMRPIEDSKVFAGTIFDNEELQQWKTSLLDLKDDYGSTMTGETLVQVCPLKTIYAEYRYWIVDGQIITKSQYKIGKRVQYSPNVDSRFDDYVVECIKIWQPLRAFVIDVCDTDHGIKIVEINTLNSSGYYAGDMNALVIALEDAFNDSSQ